MSYTGTNAQAGVGSIIAINTGTVSVPVWTTIGEVVELSQTGYQNETDDATNLQSTAREFIGTITNPGTWDLTINRYSQDAGQAALYTSFTAQPPTTKSYKLTLPKANGQVSTGDAYTFSGIVEKYGMTVKPDKKVSISAALKVSNAPVFTIGS